MLPKAQIQNKVSIVLSINKVNPDMPQYKLLSALPALHLNNPALIDSMNGFITYLTSCNFAFIDPGIPYEVVVVAFTSVGRGEVNNREVFFSEELTPSKAPENVTSERVNSTSVNISWIPLTLFEAQGFPEYTVTLAEMMDSNTRKKRQTNSITTTGSFAIFNGLDENTVYTAVVGVRTAGNPSTMMVTDPVTGMYSM